MISQIVLLSSVVYRGYFHLLDSRLLYQSAVPIWTKAEALEAMSSP
jgi:hypothetical protein